MMRRLAPFAALLALALTIGCSSTPTAKFYTLSSLAAPQGTSAAAPYSVAVGAVTVPDIVNRPQVVTRSGANQVTLDEFARWGQPLKAEIPRVIADNLSGLLDGARVTSYPQTVSADVDYRVIVDVQRFDSALGEAATVDVLWAVRPPKGGETRTGRSVAREATTGAGYDALVAAHSRALATVSRDIAAAVRAARPAQ